MTLWKYQEISAFRKLFKTLGSGVARVGKTVMGDVVGRGVMSILG